MVHYSLSSQKCPNICPTLYANKMELVISKLCAKGSECHIGRVNKKKLKLVRTLIGLLNIGIF